MAEEKKSFPMLPIKHWWALRAKFKQSIPGVVTISYLAAALRITSVSARANVLPSLKALGLIDDDGKTLERAKLWRDDVHYQETCNAILKDVYPAELLDAVPNANEERSQAERWFASKTGAGESAARRMATLYATIQEADLSRQPEQAPKSRDERAVPRERISSRKRLSGKKAIQEPERIHDETVRQPSIPEININLEIHISADATSDQIDQIFASMAKHIYRQS